MGESIRRFRIPNKTRQDRRGRRVHQPNRQEIFTTSVRRSPTKTNKLLHVKLSVSRNREMKAFFVEVQQLGAHTDPTRSHLHPACVANLKIDVELQRCPSSLLTNKHPRSSRCTLELEVRLLHCVAPTISTVLYGWQQDVELRGTSRRDRLRMPHLAFPATHKRAMGTRSRHNNGGDGAAVRGRQLPPAWYRRNPTRAEGIEFAKQNPRPLPRTGFFSGSVGRRCRGALFESWRLSCVTGGAVPVEAATPPPPPPHFIIWPPNVVAFRAETRSAIRGLSAAENSFPSADCSNKGTDGLVVGRKWYVPLNYGF